MELIKTISKIGDSTNAATHRIAEESHGLTEYIKDSEHPFSNLSLVHDDWGVVTNLGFASALIAAAIVLIVCLICSSKWVKKRLTQIATSTWSFIIVWLYGFIVYDVGMCTGEHVSLITNAPMAILYAFKIFIFDSDVSEIHEHFHESWVYSFHFAFVHFLAAIISTTFIIKYFGFNVIARIRIWWLSFSPSLGFAEKTNDLYIFWGLNDASYLMAKSIEEYYSSNPDKDYKTIIIRVPREDDKEKEHQGVFNRFFNIVSIKGSDVEKLQSLKCYSAVTNVNLKKVRLGKESNSTVDIFKNVLKLKSIHRIIKHGVTDRIHILALSDDEKQNLQNVSAILKDSTLNSFADSQDSGASTKRKVILYCHARFNGVHRVIEDQHCSKNLEVKVIDSSHLNVELLKCNKDVLPVNFVEVEADASVSSAFNAMVIGFSEVGQDATRFIYEFGAFVKYGGDNNHAERSDFHIDVIDKNMKDKAGAFVANAPSIEPSLSFIPELRNQDALIELHNDDCCSVEFYKKLEDKIKTLNYVVIATEDDELNMTMGIRIFRAATRYRDNLDRLCILIRIHNDDDGHFSEVAEYYNKLWKSQDANNIEGKIPNTKFKRADKCILPLYIFGHDKDVYTYSNIIDDTILKQAILFKERYEASTNKDYKRPADEEDFAWHEDIETLLQTGDKYHPAYACLMRLRRTQGQDMENSMHRFTKELLRDKAMQKSKPGSDFQWSSLQRYDGQTKYSSVSGADIDPRIERFLTVMAQTEHLRWKASHEILGYVYDEKGKNEIRLHHDCLTDWEKLSESTRSFDNNVVDMTFGIIDPENKIKTKGNQ